MSDIHTLPLRGRELPEALPAPERWKAHVWPAADGWWWEHRCDRRNWADSGPLASPGDAHDAALRHLKGCCR